MPALSYPAWTALESLELIAGAIEYLRTLNMRASPSHFMSDWWDYWVSVHGVPCPDDWDEVHSFEQYVAEHRRRVYRTIRWYALRGRHPPQSSYARVRRMRYLMSELINRVRQYQDAGLDFVMPRPAPFQHLFEDTLRGFNLMQLRSINYM